MSEEIPVEEATRVLLIAPDADYEMILCTMLESNACTTSVAHDAAAAYALMSRTAPHVTIIVDNPYRFDALVPFAADVARSNNPIVLLTTLQGDAAQNRGAEVFATEVLSSPADVQEVIDCVLAVRRRYAQ